MYYPSPEYLRKAANKSTALVKETGYIGAGMNISGTVNMLIQNVGRFTEQFAGDLLIDLSHVYALVGKHPVEAKGESVAIGFGIRRMGVDHNAYIMNRLSESARMNPMGYPDVEKSYRKVFVVLIDNVPNLDIRDVACTVRLFDVTDNLGKMSEKDLAWNPDDDIHRHYEDRPENAGEEWNHWASYNQEVARRTCLNG